MHTVAKLERLYVCRSSKGSIGMSDSYMQEQGAALAQHLKLTDGKSGHVEVVADGFRIHVRKKWAGKQFATWDGLPVEWNENVGSNKAANR